MTWPSMINNFRINFWQFILGLGMASFFSLVILVTPAQANENFWIDLHTDYLVASTGNTTVSHNFTITNRTPTYFINRYSITVSSVKPTNISVKMGTQILKPDVSSANNQTTITIDFPEKIVGETKALNFSIQYDTLDLAQISGKVLEVSVPPMSGPENFRKFSVSVSTPISFGPPTRNTPSAISSIGKNGLQIVNYDLAASKGINSVYGLEQFFKLNLDYSVRNPGNQPILTQITFPPDTDNQKIYYEQITPLPDSWKVDLDGNWLATYTLQANSSLTVKAEAAVKLSLLPNTNFPVQPVLAGFTQAQEFWPVTNSLIQETANQVTTPAKIYDFTLQKLTYTTADLTKNLVRLGAVKTLKEPTLATCQEYADVFITLARANGIPARRLIGYAQTKNQELRPTGLQGDILHAWVQYYDSNQNQWLAIDPTWGDTTGGIDYFNQMDLNHIVFAINGQSSVLPYPVGSYQEGQTPTKSIEVEFGESFPVVQPNLTVKLYPKKIGPLTIPGWAELVIVNPTGQAWYDLNFEPIEKIGLVTEIPIPDRILPYQTFKTTVSAYNKVEPNWFGPTNLELKLKLGSDLIAQSELKIYAIPQFISRLGFTNFGLGLAVSLIVCAFGAGSLFILGLNWKNYLRRQSQKSATSNSKLQSLSSAESEDQKNGSDSPRG